jgi:hypothetical protein
MTKAKVKEEESVEDTSVKLVAKFDCIMGKCRHYTIGSVGDVISGGLYILTTEETPDKLSITFKGE